MAFCYVIPFLLTLLLLFLIFHSAVNTNSGEEEEEEEEEELESWKNIYTIKVETIETLSHQD